MATVVSPPRARPRTSVPSQTFWSPLSLPAARGSCSLDARHLLFFRCAASLLAELIIIQRLRQVEFELFTRPNIF